VFHCRCKELVHGCDRETRQHCGGVLSSRWRRRRRERELGTSSGVGVGVGEVKKLLHSDNTFSISFS